MTHLHANWLLQTAEDEEFTAFQISAIHLIGLAYQMVFGLLSFAAFRILQYPFPNRNLSFLKYIGLWTAVLWKSNILVALGVSSGLYTSLLLYENTSWAKK